MRVALVYFLENSLKTDDIILENLKKSSEKKGNNVVLLDGRDDKNGLQLDLFDYIAVLIKPAGFLSAKVSKSVLKNLAASGSISGKLGCALVVKNGLRSVKTCRNLMEMLESQGVRLDYFDVIKDDRHALDVGAKVG